MVSEHGVMFMVRRAEIEYQRAARLDDLVTIRTTTESATGATVTLRQEFSLDGETLAVARIMLVCVRTATGGAARIPARWRDLLAA
jgi:acyl-CoA thioester hydrolase